MKKLFMVVALIAATFVPSFAQKVGSNADGDSIVGEYLVPDAKNGDSKVRFTKNAEGTFDCQVFWLEKPNDPATGKPWLDNKNPDKSLRNRRSDSLFIINGLKYNAEKQQWDGAKVYDPNRGIKANVICKFLPSGELQVKGTVLGIGESQNWKKL